MENNENYFVIQRFMVSKLGLKGNDLIIYALIHGFSQDGISYFYGSIKYIQEQTNLSKEAVLTILQKLVKTGLIIKKDTNSVKVFDSEKKSYGSVHYSLYCTAYSRNISPEQVVNQCDLNQNAQNHKDNNTEIDISNNFNTNNDKIASQEFLPVSNADTSSRSTFLTGTGQEFLPEPVKNFDPIINSDNIYNNLSSNSEYSTNHLETKNNSKTTDLSVVENKKDRQIEITNKIINIFGSVSLFDNNFILKLNSFYDKYKIENSDYITWTYNQIDKNKVSNVPSYFYKIIFSESNISRYLYEQKERQKEFIQQTENTQIKPKIYCPVCKKEFVENYENACPICNLSVTYFDDEKKVNRQIKFMAMSKEKQEKYNQALGDYMNEIPVIQRMFYFGTPEGKKKYENYVYELDKKYELCN